MAAFHSDTRPILGRGPSILLRFFFFALLAFALMWLDQRHGYLRTLRYGMDVAAYPFHVLVNSPGAAWEWLSESFSTREALQRENETLQARLREADLRMMRFEALEQENLRLRAMREATAGIAAQVMVAEIMRVDLNPYRHRVILNKGARDGVFQGQPVLDAKGVFGQITRAGPFSAEAILISDMEHAIPVQVNRNGLRSIAVGTGDLSRLNLPFLPINADINQGDLLVTSGLGGVFPPGYPVAVVTEVNKSQAQTLATVSAKPAADLDRDREVLLVWVRESPVEPEEAAPAATPGQSPATTGPRATPRQPPSTTGQPPTTPGRAPATQPATPQRPPATTPTPRARTEARRTQPSTSAGAGEAPATTTEAPAATTEAPAPTTTEAPAPTTGAAPAATEPEPESQPAPESLPPATAQDETPPEVDPPPGERE